MIQRNRTILIQSNYNHRLLTWRTTHHSSFSPSSLSSSRIEKFESTSLTEIENTDLFNRSSVTSGENHILLQLRNRFSLCEDRVVASHELQIRSYLEISGSIFKQTVPFTFLSNIHAICSSINLRGKSESFESFSFTRDLLALTP